MLKYEKIPNSYQAFTLQLGNQAKTTAPNLKVGDHAELDVRYPEILGRVQVENRNKARSAT